MKYVIITPAKDEENFIRFTLESVCNQSMFPAEWIIVDDGSTDRTVQIISEYLRKYSWIRLIRNDTYNEKRAEGSKIVRAFYKGYKTINVHDYDFLVKLDADLTLPINYFEKIAIAFQQDPKLGICGGQLYFDKYKKYVPRAGFNNYVSGPYKSYRKTCFDDIGGIMPVLGWDGIDLYTAMYKGWKTKALPLRVTTHRPTGIDYNNSKLSFLHGKAMYRSGSSFVLMIFRTFYRLKYKPFIIASISFMLGYIFSFIKNEEKYFCKDLQKFINKFHYDRIMSLLKTVF